MPYKQMISEISRVRGLIASYNDGEKDSLIKIGVALESQLEKGAEHSQEVMDAITLILHILQAIYQGGVSDDETFMSGINKILISVEQVLGSPKNPMTDMMLKQAYTNLKEEFEKNQTPEAESEQAENEQAEQDQQENSQEQKEETEEEGTNLLELPDTLDAVSLKTDAN